MALFITSFLAGVLTIGAPCVLPILPVIVGGSVAGEDKKKPYIVIASLSISLVVFTLLLKASTVLITVPLSFWATTSGGIILIFGIFTLFPHLWEKISDKFKLSSISNTFLYKSSQKSGLGGSLLIGAALGPVFSSCSPTYALIVATVLPQSFLSGVFYIIVYVIGLALMLLLVSIFGQRLVSRLKWLADPKSKFKKGLGLLFILIGILIVTGTEKRIETYFVESGLYNVSEFELTLLENAQD